MVVKVITMRKGVHSQSVNALAKQHFYLEGLRGTVLQWHNLPDNMYPYVLQRSRGKQREGEPGRHPNSELVPSL